MAKTDEKFRRDVGSLRDTVESIWVAIVLAFVLRAFMVEAFVIPTGSMAPRLMGEHWDLRCPSCGYEYAFGWRGKDSPIRSEGKTFSGAQCPNCAYGYPGTKSRHLVNGGDRVLVMKFLYHFREPKPWDVVVFRNPQSNQDNYIKRLIGLPGETIEILHGDIFVTRTPDKQDSWRIRRKPPRAQEAMWHIIFDNDYQPDVELLGEGVAPRWEVARGWRLDHGKGRRFVFLGGKTPSELTFQARREHFLPNYGYNPRDSIGDPGALYAEADVCGDLKLSAVLVPRDDKARVNLALATGREHFRAQIAADGSVVLYRRSSEGGWDEWDRASTDPLRVHRGYRVALANADRRVAVWVGGKAVLTKDYDEPGNYRRLKSRLAAFDRHVEDNGAMDPAEAERLFPTPRLKIQAVGGRCELLHLKVWRDVYYTCRKLEKIDEHTPLGEYARDHKRELIEKATDVWGRTDGPGAIAERGWSATGRPIRLASHKDEINPAPCRDLDEFFVLGDNSPKSLDGRMWTRAAPSLRLWTKHGRPQYKLGTVPRYNMIGKAIFVYWPSGFRPPVLRGLPIVPNVGRMRLIR